MLDHIERLRRRVAEAEAEFHRLADDPNVPSVEQVAAEWRWDMAEERLADALELKKDD